MGKIIIILIVATCYLMLVSCISYSQTLDQLHPNEYSVDIGLAFAESDKVFLGGISYGILKNLNGYLIMGLDIMDENPTLSSLSISIPPSPLFMIGISRVEKLGQTGLDYWSTAGLGVGFGKFIDDIEDETIMTSRSITLSTSLGLKKKLSLEGGVSVTPLAGILYNNTWITVESSIPDFIYSETESGDDWGGQLGLMIGLSPNINITGAVTFSFEHSNVSYSINLSFRL